MSEPRSAEDQLGDEYAELGIYENHAEMERVTGRIDSARDKFIELWRELDDQLKFKPSEAEQDAFDLLNDALGAYGEQIERTFFEAARVSVAEQADAGEVWRNGEDGYWYLGDEWMDTGRDDDDEVAMPAPAGDQPTELLYVNDHGNMSFQAWDGDEWKEVWSLV